MAKEKEKKCTCAEDCKCEENKECTCENEKCNCNESCECGCQEGKECACEGNCKKDDSLELLTEANNKIKDLENALLMSKADNINYRKRLDDEHARMIKYCNEDLIKELLPVLDNFERAIKKDDDNLDDDLSKFLEGFKMMYCNLVSILGKFGVVAIDGNNKPFDADFHQAVMTEKVDGMESGMVIEVMQKGYLLKEKVIRPAMVKVSE